MAKKRVSSMKKLLIVYFLLCCGINSVNAQLGGFIAKAIIDKKEKKARNSSHNFIFNKSGEIVYLKKGKEKRASDWDLQYGIDTLVFEDPSIPVGRACREQLRKYDIKIIVSNNAVYLKPRDVENRIVFDKNKDNAIFSGVQGFQAQKPSEYGHELNRKADKIVTCVKLPDAVIIDGDDGELRGYFTRAKMKKVEFSPNIRKIGKGAFRNCKLLQEVVFPKGCDNVEIDPEAFSGCDALKAIKIPSGTAQKYIDMGLSETLIVDENATLNIKIELEKPGTILEKIPMEKLNKITSLSVIGFLDENDFAIIRDCINLKYLDLSHAYTTLSEKEQSSRKANKDFLLGMLQALGEVSKEKYKNGEIAASENLEVQLFAQLAKDESQVKSASVGCVIPWNSLKGLTNLEHVILPYRAITIENYAFKDCINLKYVVLPQYIESICKGAFENCKKLNEIYIPQTLSSCHYEAFDGCKSLTKLDFSKCRFSSKDGYCIYKGCENLKEIRLPEGIEVLYNANSKSGVVYYMPKTIVKFESTIDNSVIHFKGDNPPTVKSLDHSYKPRKCEIYVPKGCMTKYYATFNGDGNTLKEE